MPTGHTTLTIAPGVDFTYSYERVLNLRQEGPRFEWQYSDDGAGVIEPIQEVEAVDYRELNAVIATRRAQVTQAVTAERTVAHAMEVVISGEMAAGDESQILMNWSVGELTAIAKQYGLHTRKVKKSDLVAAILAAREQGRNGLSA